MASNIPTLPLKCSPPRLIPVFGLGTYNIPDDKIVDVIVEAVKLGYRLFDCASVYGNQRLIGKALKQCSVPREELFIVSKVWNDEHDKVRESCMQSLKDLQLDYLDLYLVHWPCKDTHINAYKEMEKLHEEGKIRALGISNYTMEDYEELKAHMTIPPAVNQIEVNVFLYRKDTIGYFQKLGIQIMGYKPIRGQANGVEHPEVLKLATKYNKTAAQILCRWGIQKNIIVVPRTSNVGRLQENLVFDFTIEPEDEVLLDGLTAKASVDYLKQQYLGFTGKEVVSVS